MKRLILVMIVVAIAWQGYLKYQAKTLALVHASESTYSSTPAPSRTLPTASANAANYRCDGRIYCSQMTSCEEATWFLKNCPGTKMDGNGDGVPCEKQWCK